MAFVFAIAGTGATRGERGRAALVFADCGSAGAKRAAKNVTSQRQRQVVEAITGRLPTGLRVAGDNCAAVEKPNESRADFSLNETFPNMKIHLSTAEVRMNRCGCRPQDCWPKDNCRLLLLLRRNQREYVRLLDSLSLSRHGESSSELSSVMILDPAFGNSLWKAKFVGQ